MRRYAVLVVPPKKVADYVDTFRKIYNRNTKDLILPHISISSLFFLRPNFTEEMMVDKLRTHFSEIAPATICFNSIGYFDNKNKVVYFEPDHNSTEFLK